MTQSSTQPSNQPATVNQLIQVLQLVTAQTELINDLKPRIGALQSNVAALADQLVDPAGLDDVLHVIGQRLAALEATNPHGPLLRQIPLEVSAIGELNLSPAATRALASEGIANLYLLVTAIEQFNGDLTQVKGIGPKLANEIMSSMQVWMARRLLSMQASMDIEQLRPGSLSGVATIEVGVTAVQNTALSALPSQVDEPDTLANPWM
jgi:hypothetical protein